MNEIPFETQIEYFLQGVLYYVGFWLVGYAIRLLRTMDGNDHSPEL